MPDREYYLKKDDKLAWQETCAPNTWQHIEKMFDPGRAQGQRRKKSRPHSWHWKPNWPSVQWSRVELRDPVKAYNKYPIRQTGKELAPAYDWKAWLDQTGLAGKTDYLIVSQPSYIKGMAQVHCKNSHWMSWKALFCNGAS